MYLNLKLNKHKIISFNTKTMTSLGFHSWGSNGWGGGGRTFRKLISLGGTKLFARKGGQTCKGVGLI